MKRLLAMALALMLIMSVFGAVTTVVSAAEKSYVSSIEPGEDDVTVTLDGDADFSGKTLTVAFYNDDKLVSVKRETGITETSVKFNTPTAKYTKIKAFVWNASLQPFGAAVSLNVGDAIDKTQKLLKLWYNEEAPYSLAEQGKDDLYVTRYGQPAGQKEGEDYRGHTDGDPKYLTDGWQCWSMPLGNGFMGVNVFGRTEVERLQITEPSLFAGTDAGGNSIGFANFSETYIDFGHKKSGVSNYERNLILNDATANVKYTYGGVNYTREIFTSYPDKVMAIKLTASGSGKLDFTLRPTVPHIDELSLCYKSPSWGDFGKSNCSVVAAADTITLSGKMNYFGINFEGQYKVILPDGVGSMTANNPTGGLAGNIQVTGANQAIILVAIGTNYKMQSNVFTNGNFSAKLTGNGVNAHDKVTGIMTAASTKTYDEIKEDHVADYKKYFNRVNFDVGAAVPSVTTDVLVNQYKSGTYNKYLEELYFQFGRYMLIASSRQGSLPNNLQGIWNRYERPPWTSGYWHNINIQMNYWAAFPTNLPEMFEPYADYNKAYMEKAKQNADSYISQVNSDAKSPNGQNGWAVATGCWPYDLEGVNPSGHSGPGTGGYTSQMFWDYYDFTRDDDILANSYDVLSSGSLFYSKAVVPFGDKLLVETSFSPENSFGRVSVGCAFDQQMIYENHLNTLKAAEALGITNAPILDKINEQIDKLDPVIVGWGGQVKEFREERYYGEYGEYQHRHIAQLAGLFPGFQISSLTPAWLDASKVTLAGRGDGSNGWSIAYRQQMRARTKEGDTAYSLYRHLLAKYTMTNLWNTCHPFQVDGNFGGTEGVAEMLLQSHEGYIEPLPALPDYWKDGKYSGLLARGNFEVSAQWTNGQAQTFEIKSNKGGECVLKYYNLKNAEITPAVTLKSSSTQDMIAFDTTAGTTYVITNIAPYKRVANPASFTAVSAADFKTVSLNWGAVSGSGISYNIYRAVESAPGYEFITNVTGTSYTYTVPAADVGKQATYRVAAKDSTGRESLGLAKTVIPNANETFIVTFDKNGGDTEANPQTKTFTTYAAPVGTFPAPPTREGYVFLGWSMSKDGSGALLTEASKVLDSYTVYAKWMAIGAPPAGFPSGWTWVDGLDKTTDSYILNYVSTLPWKTDIGYNAPWGIGPTMQMWVKQSSSVVPKDTLLCEFTFTGTGVRFYEVTVDTWKPALRIDVVDAAGAAVDSKIYSVGWYQTLPGGVYLKDGLTLGKYTLKIYAGDHTGSSYDGVFLVKGFGYKP